MFSYVYCTCNSTLDYLKFPQNLCKMTYKVIETDVANTWKLLDGVTNITQIDP